MKEEKNRWIIVVVVLLVVGLLSIITAGILSLSLAGSVDSGGSGSVAMIPISGAITPESGSSLYSSGVAASPKIIEYIHKADSDPGIEAIVLKINSPGGTPVASDEIASAVKRANKTTVAWIREVGASGGYYIASASDTIFANAMSTTGSIGVRASYLEVAGFLKEHNITYQRIVAGEYKDAGSPLKELTPEEEARLQELVDTIHEQFINEVATNRNLSTTQVEELATGEIFLGSEAQEIGLVDRLGGKHEVTRYLEEQLNTSVSYKEYTEKQTLFNALGSVAAQHGKALGKSLTGSMEDEQPPYKLK